MHMHARVFVLSHVCLLSFSTKTRANADQSFLLDGENGQKDLGNGLNVLNVPGNIEVVRAEGSGTSWNKSEPTKTNQVCFYAGLFFAFS